MKDDCGSGRRHIRRRIKNCSGHAAAASGESEILTRQFPASNPLAPNSKQIAPAIANASSQRFIGPAPSFLTRMLELCVGVKAKETFEEQKFGSRGFPR